MTLLINWVWIANIVKVRNYVGWQFNFIGSSLWYLDNQGVPMIYKSWVLRVSARQIHERSHLVGGCKAFQKLMNNTEILHWERVRWSIALINQYCLQKMLAFKFDARHWPFKLGLKFELNLFSKWRSHSAFMKKHRSRPAT